MRALALAALLLAFNEAPAFAQSNRPVGAMTSGRAAKCYICGTAATASGQVNGVNLSWCSAHARNPIRPYQNRHAGDFPVPPPIRTLGVRASTPQPRAIGSFAMPPGSASSGARTSPAARTGVVTLSTRTSPAAATRPATTAKRPVRRHQAGAPVRAVTPPATNASAPPAKTTEPSSTGAGGR